jgi:hypothetical protein
MTKMTNSKQSQRSDEKSGSRYISLRRYEANAGSDPARNDTNGSMKNFPREFIPMKELEESPLGD